MTDLENRIKLLERKNSREKKAREIAETQLENYSRQIYLANQSLQTSLQLQTKRATELEYLVASSAQIASDDSIEEFISYFTQLTGHFCNAKLARYFLPELNSANDKPIGKFWTSNQGWHTDQTISNAIDAFIPSSNPDVLNEWLICPADITIHNQEKKLNWMYFLSFQTEKDSMGWIAFFFRQRIY